MLSDGAMRLVPTFKHYFDKQKVNLVWTCLAIGALPIRQTEQMIFINVKIRRIISERFSSSAENQAAY